MKQKSFYRSIKNDLEKISEDSYLYNEICRNFSVKDNLTNIDFIVSPKNKNFGINIEIFYNKTNDLYIIKRTNPSFLQYYDSPYMIYFIIDKSYTIYSNQTIPSIITINKNDINEYYSSYGRITFTYNNEIISKEYGDISIMSNLYAGDEENPLLYPVPILH